MLNAQDLQSKYDAVRCYKSHIDGVKKDRALETHLMVAWPGHGTIYSQLFALGNVVELD